MDIRPLENDLLDLIPSENSTTTTRSKLLSSILKLKIGAKVC